MRTSRIGRLVTSAAVVSATFAVASPVSASDGYLPISASTTLTEDHFGTIDITGDDVTLDCGGHRIDGTSSQFGIGVTVLYRSGVTIRNCDISGFVEGVSLTGAYGSRVVDNTIHEVNEAVVVYQSAEGNLVKDNTIYDAGIGVWVLDGPQANTVKGNSISGTSWSGILVSGTDATKIQGNTVNASSWTGILVEYSTNAVVRENSVSGSGWDGIGVFWSAGTRVVENAASHNAASGIAVFQSSASRVWENTSDANGQHGVFAVVTDSAASRFWENSACGNAILDGRDYSQVLGYLPGTWLENDFCTGLVIDEPQN